ncbi:MAG: hypothetical protein ACRESC_04190 [Gammaproteobacteria bacterium]
MNRNSKLPGTTALVLAALVATAGVAFAKSGKNDRDHAKEIKQLLNTIQSGVSYTSNTADAINTELTDPGNGLAAINAGVQAIQAQLQSTGAVNLSSGPFLVPQESGGSVDWDVVNDSNETQTVTVTVYQLMIAGGPKQVAAPGPLTVTLAPGETIHNANNISPDGPFMSGVYYEVVVNSSGPDILPMLDIWQTNGGYSVIPGTSIPAGSWVKLQ